MSLAMGGLVSEKTEQHTETAVLTNRLSQSCVLRGYPTIALLDGRGRDIPFAYSHSGAQMITHAPPKTVIVPGGGSAFFGFNKDGCQVRVSRIARTLRVALPGSPRQRSTVIPHSGIEYCGPGFGHVP